MLAKKFALGVGLTVTLPLLIHYGVSTFSSPPKWEDYTVEHYFERHERATEDEQLKLEEETTRLKEQYKQHQKRFQKHLFYVAVPVGLIAIIIGSIVGIQAVGTGLMFGGIFTLTDGYFWYWSELQHWVKFLSLLIAFVILVYIGYRKFSDE